jgi:hypothetical protein
MDQKPATQNVQLAAGQPQSGVTEQLFNISTGVGSVFEQLSVLEDRLGSILGSTPVNDNAGTPTTVVNGSSGMVLTLAQINDKIVGLEMFVNNLKNRVEL